MYGNETKQLHWQISNGVAIGIVDVRSSKGLFVAIKVVVGLDGWVVSGSRSHSNVYWWWWGGGGERYRFELIQSFRLWRKTHKSQIDQKSYWLKQF